MKVIVGVIGQAGHALPALRLTGELVSRGHEVKVHTEGRWSEVAEAAGATFAGSGTQIVNGLDGAAEPAAADVAAALAESIRDFGADVVVGDGLTLTPALAAEVTGIPNVTLFPEVYPFAAPGMPYFSLGLMPPRTRLGRFGWRALAPLFETRLPTTGWLRASRVALNEEREKLGLAALRGRHGPTSEGMTLVATLPELEYPRSWPAGVHVTGPMILDLPQPELELPAGEEPLVLIAPSTVKDPERRLVSTALEALDGEPLRVVASTSGAAGPDRRPENATVAGWIDYARLMPAASLVISNGTHGTLAQALSLGVPVVVCPAMPDDAEHGARVAWAGAGLTLTRRPPTPAALRAVVRRVLADPGFAAKAQQIAAGGGTLEGATRGAELIERFAA